MSLPRGNLSLFISSFLCRIQGSLPLAGTPGKEATCGVSVGSGRGFLMESTGGGVAIRVFSQPHGPYTVTVRHVVGSACPLLGWEAV